MTITYYFGEYNDEEFEYEIDPYEYVESLEKPQQWKLAQEMLDNFNEIIKEDAVREFPDCIDSNFDIVKQDDELLYFILHEYGTEEDVFNADAEGIENFFEKDAFKEYNDMQEYHTNPLWYYGMSEKDFL